MPDERPDEIVRELYIHADPETVFGFLTDPGKMRRWIGRTLELDPRPGGIFRIDVNGRDVVRGAFVEVIPPRRVVFTWGWEGTETEAEAGARDRPEARVPPGSTTVEVTLEPREGGTLLRLRHRGLTGPDRERHAFGWTHYLSRLGTAAAGGEPGPDPLGTPETLHG